jgi:hypothetical protein
MARFKQDAAAQEALSQMVKLGDVRAEDFDTVFYLVTQQSAPVSRAA